MGRSSRTKGKLGELQARDELKRIGCLRAKRRVRNLQGEDDLTDAIEGVSFEVKLEKRSNINAAIKQAIEQAGDAVPAVLHRQSVRGERDNPWCLTIRVEDLPTLLRLYSAECQTAASSADPPSTPS